MIKFKSFSSGSCGNCYFLGSFDDAGKCTCGVIIDAGVSPRQLKKGLEAEGLSFDSLQAVLVTHDHGDHIRSLGSYCKHLKKPVFARKELLKALSYHPYCKDWIGTCSKTLKSGWNQILTGQLKVRWFCLPHDASDNVGYAIDIDGYRFLIMTDVGRVTEEALELAGESSTVVIESNYDSYMLEHGPYTPELKDRIRSGSGHLSNDECAEAIRRFAHPGLKNVFLCHLSDHNNTPELALKCSRPVLDPAVRLVPLPRQTASVFFSLSL